jgi:ArsR family transcriptional regulator, arsenate/arsenite/antimonite-responsive transcriptional repressor
VAMERDMLAACCAPVGAPGISAEQSDSLAAIFKALADPHRVRIVNLLATADAPVCVCDVVPHVGLAQPTVSFHLKKLHRAGLIEREQRGTWAYYSLNRSAMGRLASVLEPKGLAG